MILELLQSLIKFIKSLDLLIFSILEGTHVHVGLGVENEQFTVDIAFKDLITVIFVIKHFQEVEGVETHLKIKIGFNFGTEGKKTEKLFVESLLISFYFRGSFG